MTHNIKKEANLVRILLILVLLTAHAKRFRVSHMGDFFLNYWDWHKGSGFQECALPDILLGSSDNGMERTGVGRILGNSASQSI